MKGPRKEKGKDKTKAKAERTVISPPAGDCSTELHLLRKLLSAAPCMAMLTLFFGLVQWDPDVGNREVVPGKETQAPPWKWPQLYLTYISNFI